MESARLISTTTLHPRWIKVVVMLALILSALLMAALVGGILGVFIGPVPVWVWSILIATHVGGAIGVYALLAANDRS